jgi:hypothetical protein
MEQGSHAIGGTGVLPGIHIGHWQLQSVHGIQPSGTEAGRSGAQHTAAFDPPAPAAVGDAAIVELAAETDDEALSVELLRAPPAPGVLTEPPQVATKAEATIPPKNALGRCRRVLSIIAILARHAPERWGFRRYSPSFSPCEAT